MKRYIKSNTDYEVWFTSSSEPITELRDELSQEVGLHCGTREQAHNRHPDGYLYEVHVTPGYTSFHFNEDINDWHGFEFWRLLKQNYIGSESDLMALRSQLQNCYDVNKRKQYSDTYRNYLVSHGYDAFTYPNGVEGQGTSLCILRTAIVTELLELDNPKGGIIE